MQDNHLFEYAVIRIVPRVEREEFLNAGIVLYCASEKYLNVLYKIDESRIRCFCDRIDMEEVTEYLKAFEMICKGGKAGGPIGKLAIAERFRWLTATRSTIMQSSKVHPGFCTDAAQKLQDLFEKLVQ